jgi:hypothetical protein
VAVGSNDYHLSAASQCLDQVLELSADALAPDYEYVSSITGRTRTVSGSAGDLGAFEYVP